METLRQFAPWPDLGSVERVGGVRRAGSARQLEYNLTPLADIVWLADFCQCGWLRRRRSPTGRSATCGCPITTRALR